MIATNRIRCLCCNDRITSYNVHDFKYCKCGKVAVDGGHLYLKRCGNPEDWKDESIITQYPWEKKKEDILCAKDISEVNLKDIKEVIHELERYMYSYCMYKEKEEEAKENGKEKRRRN